MLNSRPGTGAGTINRIMVSVVAMEKIRNILGVANVKRTRANELLQQNRLLTTTVAERLGFPSAARSLSEKSICEWSKKTDI